MDLRGSLVALVTPFDARGAVDRPALRALLTRQLEAGTDGIVACGTTGEAATLSDEEFAQVVGVCREVLRGSVPLVAGTGTNNTATTIERTRLAREQGADAALVVVPYYNKPTPAGLVEHFAAVATQGGLPVVAYNVPSRTGSAPALPTLVRVAGLPGVVALKEATGDLGLACDLVAALGDEVALLSGDDPSALAFGAVGGHGAISVTANVTPRRCAEMWQALQANDLPTARRMHLELMPLHRALFWETNPIPAKEALHQLELIEANLRLPLVRLAEPLRFPLRAVLQQLDVLRS